MKTIDYKQTSDTLRESAIKLQRLTLKQVLVLKDEVALGQVDPLVGERLDELEVMQEAAKRLYAAADIFNLLGAVPGEGESKSNNASTGE